MKFTATCFGPDSMHVFKITSGVFCMASMVRANCTNRPVLLVERAAHCITLHTPPPLQDVCALPYEVHLPVFLELTLVLRSECAACAKYVGKLPVPFPRRNPPGCESHRRHTTGRQRNCVGNNRSGKYRPEVSFHRLYIESCHWRRI
jgi:hypothetical protein